MFIIFKNQQMAKVFTLDSETMKNLFTAGWVSTLLKNNIDTKEDDKDVNVPVFSNQKEVHM